MFKKIMLPMLVVALMLVIAFGTTGCGPNDDGDFTVISMLFMESATDPFRADWDVLRFFEEEHGVRFNAQSVPGADFGQRRSILFASGDIPDVTINAWPGEMSQFAQDGLLLPVSAHLDLMPNFNEVVTEWDMWSELDNIRELDGEFYIMPGLGQHALRTVSFGIREDIFEDLEIPIPETYDDLFNALVILNEEFPDSLGLGEYFSGQQMMAFMAPAFGTHGGFSLPWGYAWHWDRQEWYFAPTSPEMRDMLRWFNNLYEAGGLDREAFTQDSNQWGRKVATELYLVFPLSATWERRGTENNLREAGVEHARVKQLFPLAGPAQGPITQPSSRVQGGAAISSRIERRDDFAEVMAFLDWLYYSEESAIISAWGIEGVHWTFDESIEGYVRTRDDIATVLNPDAPFHRRRDFGIGYDGLASRAMGRITSGWGIRYADMEVYTFNRTIMDNNWTPIDDPIVRFTQQQTDRTRLLITALNDFNNTMRFQFIYGQACLDDDWDNFVAENVRRGSEELMEVVNTAWRENHGR